MKTKRDYPYIDDFVDDQTYVFSTLGRGPEGRRGEAGEQGPQGPKGDTVNVYPITTEQIDEITSDNEIIDDLKALTATGLTYLWTKLKEKFAFKLHKHNASDIESGMLSIDNGGTGSNTAELARQSLDVPSNDSFNNLMSNFAVIEETNIASTNYPVGSYLVLNETLYKVISALSEHDQIIPDINVNNVTVGNNLTYIYDSIESIENSLTRIENSLTRGTVQYIASTSMSVTQGGGSILSSSSLNICPLFGNSFLFVFGDIVINDPSVASSHEIEISGITLPFEFSTTPIGGWVALHPNMERMESVLIWSTSPTKMRIKNRDYTSGLGVSTQYVRFSIFGFVKAN